MQIPRGYVHGAEDSGRKDARTSGDAGRLVTVAEQDFMTGTHACEVTEGND